MCWNGQGKLQAYFGALETPHNRYLQKTRTNWIKYMFDVYCWNCDVLTWGNTQRGIVKHSSTLWQTHQENTTLYLNTHTNRSRKDNVTTCNGHNLTRYYLTLKILTWTTIQYSWSYAKYPTLLYVHIHTGNTWFLCVHEKSCSGWHREIETDSFIDMYKGASKDKHCYHIRGKTGWRHKRWNDGSKSGNQQTVVPAAVVYHCFYLVHKGKTGRHVRR